MRVPQQVKVKASLASFHFSLSISVSGQSLRQVSSSSRHLRLGLTCCLFLQFGIHCVVTFTHYFSDFTNTSVLSNTMTDLENIKMNDMVSVVSNYPGTYLYFDRKQNNFYDKLNFYYYFSFVLETFIISSFCLLRMGLQ